MTYSESEFKFTFETEHDIPNGGYLEIVLPEEMNFSNETVITQQIDHDAPNTLKFNNITENTISFNVPNGLKTSERSVSLTLKQIFTPRSFRPSSGFTVYTKNADGYIVDSGGQDIAVTMDTMNTMTDLQIE